MKTWCQFESHNPETKQTVWVSNDNYPFKTLTIIMDGTTFFVHGDPTAKSKYNMLSEDFEDLKDWEEFTDKFVLLSPIGKKIDIFPADDEEEFLEEILEQL